MWNEIANNMGITEPINGSWIQAICESLGITDPINGSWIQALAQQGIPTPVEPLENNSIMQNFLITDYQPGAGPKGADLYSFVLDIYIDDPELSENCIMIITDNNFGFIVGDGISGVQSICTFAGATTGRTIVRIDEAIPTSPRTYTIETQILDTVTKQVSEINSFEYTLQAP